MRIELSHEEIERALACVNFIDEDKSTAGAFIRLQSNGQQRLWTGTNGIQLIMRRGELDTREYQLLLTSGQVAFMYSAVLAEQAVVIEIDDDGEVSILTGIGSMSCPQKFGVHPADGFEISKIEEGASGEFKVQEISTFVKTQILALNAADGEDKSVQLALVEGHLNIYLDTEYAGLSRATLTGRGVQGDVQLSVNIEFLSELLEQFGEDGELHIGLPKFTKDPIVIRNSDTIACLMPLRTAFNTAREHVQAIIEEQYGHLSAKTDSDGDYVLRRHGHLIYGRLRGDSDPVAFQVFGILLRDIELNSELLHEINQINANSTFVKVSHLDSLVVVTDDLVASSLDEVELTTSVSKVAKALDDYAHTLSVVYGGVAGEDPAEIRWNRYRDTIVKAELFPEVLSDLNGPSAIKDWPFPEVVHVVSGYNPQGIAFDGEYVNSQIAADVMQMGGKFVLGAGVSADGDYSEPSLVVWGLDRDQLREIARKASQDAIFEITANEISLVSSYSSRIETFTRMSNVGDHNMPGYL